MSFTSPPYPIMTFWGDRSRCTIPSGAPSTPTRSWTCASAWHISTAIATASGQPILSPDLYGALPHVGERAALDVLDDRVGLAVLVGRGLEHLRDARGG